MTTKKYNISVSGKDDAECQAKMKSLSVLAGSLTKAELERLAYIIKHDPKTLDTARTFLNL